MDDASVAKLLMEKYADNGKDPNLALDPAGLAEFGLYSGLM